MFKANNRLSLRMLSIVLVVVLSRSNSAQDVDIISEQTVEKTVGILRFSLLSDDHIGVLFSAEYNMGLSLFDTRTKTIAWTTGPLHGDTVRYVNLFDAKQIGNNVYQAVGISQLASGRMAMYPASYIISDSGRSFVSYMDSTKLVRNVSNQACILPDNSWLLTGYEKKSYSPGQDTLRSEVPAIHQFDQQLSSHRFDTIPSLYRLVSQPELNSVDDLAPVPNAMWVIATKTERSGPGTCTVALLDADYASVFVEQTPQDSTIDDENPRVCFSVDGVCIALTRRYPDNDSFRVVVRKLSLQGSQLFETLVNISSRYSQVMSCRATRDGGCLVVVSAGADTKYQWQQFRYCLLRINSNGSLRWSKYWSKQIGCILFDAIEMSDGEILVGGTYNDSLRQYYGYLARLREVTSTVSDTHLEQSETIRIVPMPSSNYIDVKCKGQVKSVQIRNVHGAVQICDSMLLHDTLRLDLTYLVTGVYTLAANVDEVVHTKSFVVVK